MINNKKYDFFISYRRSGNIDAVHNLVSILRRDLGYCVFFDLDNIGVGDFEESILDSISNSTYFLPIITEGCFDRCVENEDWLYREISHARQEKRTIIPIILPGASIPSKKILPKKIEFIATQNGVEHTPKAPKNTINELLKLIGHNTPDNLSKLFGLTDTNIKKEASEIEIRDRKQELKQSTYEKLNEKQFVKARNNSARKLIVLIAILAIVFAAYYMFENGIISFNGANSLIKTQTEQLSDSTVKTVSKKEKEALKKQNNTKESTRKDLATTKQTAVADKDILKKEELRTQEDVEIADNSSKYHIQGFSFKYKGAFLDSINGINSKEAYFEWVIPNDKVLYLLDVECIKDKLSDGESGLEDKILNYYIKQWSIGLKSKNIPYQAISFHSRNALMYQTNIENASMLGIFFLGKDKWYKLKVVGPEGKLQKAVKNFEKAFELL